MSNDEIGGPFKFFIKENDVLNFKYYDNTMYCVKATITRINYNEIEFSFDSGILKPLELYNMKIQRKNDRCLV